MSLVLIFWYVCGCMSICVCVSVCVCHLFDFDSFVFFFFSSQSLSTSFSVHSSLFVHFFQLHLFNFWLYLNFISLPFFRSCSSNLKLHSIPTSISISISFNYICLSVLLFRSLSLSLFSFTCFCLSYLCANSNWIFFSPFIFYFSVEIVISLHFIVSFFVCISSIKGWFIMVFFSIFRFIVSILYGDTK